MKDNIKLANELGLKPIHTNTKGVCATCGKVITEEIFCGDSKCPFKQIQLCD